MVICYLCDNRRNTKQTNIYRLQRSHASSIFMQFCIFINNHIIYCTYKSNISYMRFGILLRLLLVSRWKAVEQIFYFCLQSLGGRKKESRIFLLFVTRCQIVGKAVLFILMITRWRAKRRQDISAFGHKCQRIGKAGFFSYSHQVAGKKKGGISSAFGHQMVGRKESRYSLQEISDLQRII